MPRHSYSQARILGPIPDHRLLSPNSRPPIRICSRCLKPAHDRPYYCNSVIRCRKCLSPGHNSSNYTVHPRLARPGISASTSPRPSQPLTAGSPTPKFSTFGDYFTKVTGHPPQNHTLVPWSKTWSLKAPEFDDDDDEPSSSAVLDCRPPEAVVSLSFGEFASKVLGIPSSSPCYHIAWSQENPIFATVTPQSVAMAYRFIDPQPFLPPGAQRIMVPGRQPLMHVVIGRVQERNNDVAIAYLHPMPQHQVNFDFIRDTSSNFLNVQLGIPTFTIQPCPHGQAYVCFSHMFHRDLLIHNSPHEFRNGHISFIPHNRAWNNRIAVFTHEVWLLLIGLNLDLWSHFLVEKAVSQFGDLIVWEENHDHMVTVLVKARVCGLESIPWFFNFTEGSDLKSNCWIAQCEILLTRMLGAQTQDEDFPPEDPDDVHPNNFDFFGYG